MLMVVDYQNMITYLVLKLLNNKKIIILEIIILNQLMLMGRIL